MSLTTTGSPGICDNSSVGVIVNDRFGRYLVFDRNAYPPGAPCAGHVDEHGTAEAPPTLRRTRNSGLSSAR